MHIEELCKRQILCQNIYNKSTNTTKKIRITIQSFIRTSAVQKRGRGGRTHKLSEQRNITDCQSNHRTNPSPPRSFHTSGVFRKKIRVYTITELSLEYQLTIPIRIKTYGIKNTIIFFSALRLDLKSSAPYVITQ